MQARSEPEQTAATVMYGAMMLLPLGWEGDRRLEERRAVSSVRSKG